MQILIRSWVYPWGGFFYIHIYKAIIDRIWRYTTKQIPYKSAICCKFASA